MPDQSTVEHVNATLTVAASATSVFAILADPTTHAAIDGTGWVQQALDPAPLTEPDQIFRMNMYHANHPDGAYRTINRVELFDAPQIISWLPGYEKDDGQLDFGGWSWRYDLVPHDPATTEVTLTYDWSAVPQPIREYLRFPPFSPGHLTASLHHLAELATRPPQPSTSGRPALPR
ncbi:SRPBCC family protein [Amycolatopsis jiangsuensis]|uniref:Polyketide cyclase n=1 Tax=Amycolatopsis jiangsuensis TaxID=1181879 RepID=A0A840J3E1_9PSEU|nr:polyketide cyclase [Amycolatopsis jiangsuensis]MBB4688393.1 hypothetical protein [Amycolatopsis jiangsuensis]